MRTKYYKTKQKEYIRKDKKNPFPLYKDKIYNSLTPEQQKFVYNIFLQPVTNWSNTQCFQDATTRDIMQSTAYTYACELLKNPKIVHCVEKVKKHYRRQLRITPERILKEEASIAFSDVAKYFDENGYLIHNPAKLPSVIRRAISSVKRVSNNKTGQERYEVTLWNKGDSLSRLQKVMGMNSPTEHKIAGDINTTTTVIHKIDLSSLSDYDISVLKDVQKKLKVIDTPIGN